MFTCIYMAPTGQIFRNLILETFITICQENQMWFGLNNTKRTGTSHVYSVQWHKITVKHISSSRTVLGCQDSQRLNQYEMFCSSKIVWQRILLLLNATISFTLTMTYRDQYKRNSWQPWTSKYGMMLCYIYSMSCYVYQLVWEWFTVNADIYLYIKAQRETTTNLISQNALYLWNYFTFISTISFQL